MSQPIDLQPETPDVLQSEAYKEKPVKVCIDAPVRTQDLPRKGGAARTKTIDANFTPLLQGDAFRAKATIICSGNPILISFAKNGQDAAFSLTWPVGIPYYHTARTPLYVASTTGNAVVSYATELWAMGD